MERFCYSEFKKTPLRIEWTIQLLSKGIRYDPKNGYRFRFPIISFSITNLKELSVKERSLSTIDLNIAGLSNSFAFHERFSEIPNSEKIFPLPGVSLCLAWLYSNWWCWLCILYERFLHIASHEQLSIKDNIA